MSGCHPIDYSLLRRLVPHYHSPKGFDLGHAQEQNLTLLAIYLDRIIDLWGVSTLLRKAHFLGQSAEETTDFTSLYESRLDGQPVDGRAYEGRRGLGNVRPGDGGRYIGRGAIQVTGRANYASAEADVDAFYRAHASVAAPSLLGDACRSDGAGFVDHPERMADFPGAIDAACAYWVRHGLNSLADQDNVAAVTSVINPNLLGFEKRRQNVERAKRLLAEPSEVEVGAALRADEGYGGLQR